MGVRVFQTRILSVRAQTAQRLLLDHQFWRCKCARLLGWPSTGTAVDRAKRRTKQHETCVAAFLICASQLYFPRDFHTANGSTCQSNIAGLQLQRLDCRCSAYTTVYHT